MIISLNDKLYRVESSVKVSVPKGTPFIKVKLRDLNTDDIVEKNFKLNQPVQDVQLAERRLEFLYIEGRDYLFLDVDSLEQVLIPAHVVGNRVNYLKEGVELKASFYGNTTFAVELPQFLELMVSRTEDRPEDSSSSNNGTKIATLETGAKIEVPSFIEVGDNIRVDTKTDEFIHRV
jgi:elongation factor P